MAAQLALSDITQRLGAQFGPGWTPDAAATAGAAGAITGIAVSWTPTIDVLKRAAARQLNLIVSLEPPFWNGKAPEGRSPTAAEMGGDPTFKIKQALLDQHGLRVLDVRAGWTSRADDGQLRGLARALGWEPHYRPKAGMAPWARGNHAFALPAASFGTVAANIKRQLNANTIRCIGNPSQRVSRAALTHGYFLVPDLQRVLEDPAVDLVVCGEACEWEAAPYFMDLIASGQKKAMIMLGSQVSSDPGCGELAAWLRGFVKEVPVEWLPAGEPFHTVG